MTTLAHPTLNGSAGTCSAARAVLERAIAAAPSNIPPPRGLRRLFPRDRSAAALITRYGLRPAIENAYDRVTREFGHVDVEVSAEHSFGTEFLMVVFNCNSWDFDRMHDVADEASAVARRLMKRQDWFRLVIGVDPHPDFEPTE